MAMVACLLVEVLVSVLKGKGVERGNEKEDMWFGC